MKILIASDLHGSAEYCRQLIEAFKRENADKLLLLGDILYHGPRNDLPEEYSPKSVLNHLETVKDKIICVQGNCDADIDTRLLPFPVLPSFGAVFSDGIEIYFAHGHNDAPPLKKGDVYLTGHTHVPVNEMADGYYHLNPGSVSLPKEGSVHGYLVYENRRFIFKNLDGTAYDELEIKEEDEPSSESAPVVKPMPAPVRRPQIVRRKIIVRRR